MSIITSVTQSLTEPQKHQTNISSSQASFFIMRYSNTTVWAPWFTHSWKAVKHGLTHSFIHVVRVLHTVTFSHCASFNHKFQNKPFAFSPVWPVGHFTKQDDSLRMDYLGIEMNINSILLCFIEKNHYNLFGQMNLPASSNIPRIA